MDNGKCQNCYSELTGSYCHSCGQKFIKVPYTWRGTLKVLVEAFEFDSGFLATLLSLFVRPGAVVRAYLKGVTVKYTNPAKYITSIVSIGLIIAFLVQLVSSNEKTGTNSDIEVMALEYIGPRLAFAFDLVVVMLFNFYFLRSKWTFFEHLIVMTFEFGQLSLITFFALALWSIKIELAMLFLSLAILAYHFWFTTNVFLGSPSKKILVALGSIIAMAAVNTIWFVFYIRLTK